LAKFVPKLEIQVAFDSFIVVYNDVVIIQELTGDEIMSEILMERNETSGDDVTLEDEEEKDDDGDDEQDVQE
jgi:hypothetical protein